jgi:hypothetical protein
VLSAFEQWLGLTLTAGGQIDICFAGALNGWLYCHCLVAAQNHLDIARIKLKAAAAAASLFACNECRSQTEEWVDDDIAALGHVEKRIF